MARPVRMQIVSDLHLETPKFRPCYSDLDITPETPYLALLGDIGNVVDEALFDFLRRQLRRFEIVFFVIGNHEPYHSNHEYCKNRLNSFSTEVEACRFDDQSRNHLSEFGAFVLLDRMRFDIPGTNVTILGCTLFSRISEAQQESVAKFVNDFSGFGEGYIANWTTTDHNNAHTRDLNWLNEEVFKLEQEASDRTVVIFTHYSPTLLSQANDARFANDAFNTQSAFVTDLSEELCWSSGMVKFWGFGHTHFNCDFSVQRSGASGGTCLRVFANQRGYSRQERVDFNASKVVILESDDKESFPNQWTRPRPELEPHVQRTQRASEFRPSRCTLM